MKSKKVTFEEVNTRYINSLEEMIVQQEETINVQEQTIDFLKEQISLQEEKVELLELLNENLNELCKANGLKS
jgi:hypothetical protein